MSIPKYLKNALSTGEESDFSIFVFDDQGQKIEKKVHKLVIRQSPYFSAMLDLKGKEAKSGSVTIDNITKDILEHALTFLYSEELPEELTMEQALDVASAADYLQLSTLRQEAAETWKELFLELDVEEVVPAFRLFVQRSGLTPDASWREAMEWLLVGMFNEPNEGEGEEFDIETESRAFIEQLINFFGQSHPYTCVDYLCSWTLSEGVDITNKEKNERKKVAADLVKKINWMDITLRNIALLSHSEALPKDFMLETIYNKAKSDDDSVTGHVAYNISLIKPRIIELEHETGYVLFKYHGFSEGKQKKIFWEHLSIPNNCNVQVTIEKPNSEIAEWPAESWSGHLQAKVLDTFTFGQRVKFTVYLKYNNNDADNDDEDDIMYYDMDYDSEDEANGLQ